MHSGGVHSHSRDQNSNRKISGAYFIHHTVTCMLRSPSARHPITRRDWNTIGRPGGAHSIHSCAPPTFRSLSNHWRNHSEQDSFLFLFIPFHSFSFSCGKPPLASTTLRSSQELPRGLAELIPLFYSSSSLFTIVSPFTPAHTTTRSSLSYLMLVT